MSRWTPCKRREFIKRLRALGFEGPYAGSKHQYMVLNNHRLAIPSNPEYSTGQLQFMLKEVELLLDRRITVDDWNQLR